tara:strand:- start:862 stop:1155 length:294 start_codon:yes stop_codon:yes gene_type:complete
MNSDRIKEIQQTTAYPNSVSVQQALLQVWNECEQERVKNCSIPVVVRSSSLKNENSKLNDVEFYDLMQMYRMAEMTDQEKTVKRFEAVKEWIRLNYA